MKNGPDNIRSKMYLILSGKKLTDTIRKKNNPIFLKIYLIPITDRHKPAARLSEPADSCQTLTSFACFSPGPEGSWTHGLFANFR